jgi:hypothetical protein
VAEAQTTAAVARPLARLAQETGLEIVGFQLESVELPRDLLQANSLASTARIEQTTKQQEQDLRRRQLIADADAEAKASDIQAEALGRRMARQLQPLVDVMKDTAIAADVFKHVQWCLALTETEAPITLITGTTPTTTTPPVMMTHDVGTRSRRRSGQT